jgi:hypothetical protein
MLALVGSLSLTAPVMVRALTYTHFVSPDGSPTSFCTQSEPCSLTRAVSLIGSRDMPPGSTVLVQYGTDGIYAQPALTFAGSGTAQSPIKFIGEDGVRLTGTRFKPEVSAWKLVPGRRYTYQLDWDEAVQGFANMPAHRPPVRNWRPIWVEDRLPPFTTPARRFDMTFPPRYTARTSINAVEAQAGTAWTDTASNKIYVHLFDDTAPPSADSNLYITSGGWGTIAISGDYLWLENIAMEHASQGGNGLKVNLSANGTTLKKITARAAQVVLEGTNTLVEDLDVSHAIMQDTHPTQCYDANPDFGQGECWNAAGNGRALIIGREDSQASFGQVVRRAFVHRSWNGAALRGANTLEYSTLWGFPNHTLSASGSGTTIRHNIVLNGQDSLYMGSAELDNLTVEHNLFVNGVYITVSDHGKGGTPPRAWRFWYNVLPAVVYDQKTYDTVSSDCNAWIPSSPNPSHMMRVIGTDGGSGFQYDTLEQIQARTPLERRSVALPHTKWTDGTLFRRFDGQSAVDFDFSPASAGAALEACGRRIGPAAASLAR